MITLKDLVTSYVVKIHDNSLTDSEHRDLLKTLGQFKKINRDRLLRDIGISEAEIQNYTVKPSSAYTAWATKNLPKSAPTRLLNPPISNPVTGSSLLIPFTRPTRIISPSSATQILPQAISNPGTYGTQQLPPHIDPYLPLSNPSYPPYVPQPFMGPNPNTQVFRNIFQARKYPPTQNLPTTSQGGGGGANIPPTVNLPPLTPPGGGGGGSGFNFNVPQSNSPLWKFLRAVMPVNGVRRINQALQGANAVQAAFNASTFAFKRPAMSAAAGIGGAGFGYAVNGGWGAVGGGIGGAIGGIFGPIGGTIGSIIGTFVSKIPEQIVKNIKASAHYGAVAADAISQGIIAGLGHLQDVGGKLLITIVSAIVRPLGASGGAISSFVSSLVSTFNVGFKGILGFTASSLKVLAGLYGGAVTTAFTMFFGLIPILLGPLFMGIGALLGSFIGKAITGVFSVIGQAAGAVAEHLGELFGEVGKVATQAFTSVLEILQDILGTAQSHANEYTQYSANTGSSLLQSISTLNNFQLAGISPQQTNQMFGGFNQINPIFKAKAGLFGLPERDNPEFLPKFAEQFQNSSIWRRRIMTETLGMSGASANIVGMTDPNRLRSNIQFGQTVQNSLGMSPEKIKEFAGGWNLMTDRATFFFDLVKEKFASIVLPDFTKGLAVASNFIGQHIGQIYGWIKAGAEYFVTSVKWMFINVPSIVINVAQGVLGILRTVTGFVANFLSGTANAILAFRNGNGLFPLIHSFAQGFDLIMNLFRDFIILNVGSGTLFLNAINQFKTSMSGFLPAIFSPTLGIAKWIFDFFKNPTNLSSAATNYNIAQKIPVSNLTGTVDAIMKSQMLGQVQTGLYTGAAGLNKSLAPGGIFDIAQNSLNDLGKKFSVDKMQKVVDDFNRGVQTFATVSAKGTTVNVAVKDNPNALYNVSAFIARDIFNTASSEGS